jgi:ABC-2 type transport system permease protein
MLSRIWAMIRKEFIQMARDRATLGIMLMIPIIQLTLFGAAINTDVKNIPLAVLDNSNTEESRDLIGAFTNNQYFVLKGYTNQPAELKEWVDRGFVKVGLVIDPNFAIDLKRARPAKVQVFVDASDPIVASSTLSNASGIAQIRSSMMLFQRLRPGSSYTPEHPPVDIQIRAWYNPDLVTSNHIVPGLIGVILTLTMMTVTSMAIVRERETGTLEQLATTPLRPIELMLGKIIPYVLVGYIQVTVALVIGVVVFQVPIRGSVPLLYSLASLQILTYLGLGILLSTGPQSAAGQSDGHDAVSAQYAVVRIYVPARGDAALGPENRTCASPHLFSPDHSRHRHEGAEH